MKQNLKRLMSFLLSLTMAFGVMATPAFATGTEAEANAAADEAQADTSAEQSSDLPSTFSLVTFQADEDVEVDEDDPVIATVMDELDQIKVLNDEGESVPLTEEQQENVLGLYAQFKQQWEANADLLGVQMPFYLQYNDDKDDLGALGEMLVLAGVSVDAVRSGDYSYNDLTGMLMNFYYGDMYGLKYYGDTIRTLRNEALRAVEESGAQTDYQKLLVLNDWLATVDSFDMSYIMNSGREEPTMQAEDPQPHEHYEDLCNAMKDVYQPIIEQQFYDQVYAGIVAELRQQYYEGAIKQIVYEQAYQKALASAADPENPTDEEKATAETAAQAEADEYMTKNAEAIAEDAPGFVKANFGEDAAAQIAQGADAFIKTAEEEGVEVDPENAPGYTMTVEELTQQQLDSDEPVDLDGDGTPETTFQDAIPIYTEQAAAGMATGILGYWEGSHIGALAEGKSVCLGYSEAYAYLVQCLYPEIYLKEGATDIDDASNWKTAKDLYYDENGNLDIDQNYAVDLVRITYEADVTMYGEEQPEFNSDHFWNAVKVDGQWYYTDPCYNDVYSEVMMRDRVEIAGYINHLYFMFSHDSAAMMYDGYYSALKTLYADAAVDKTYEDSWFSRAKSNVYSDGSSYYYVYDSTDLISLLEKYNDSQGSQEDMTELMSEVARYKLVKHDITGDDTGDGDTDYTALIEFNYSEDDEEELGVARVYNPETGEMEENELLTALYAQHTEMTEVYPSIYITTALSGGKLYFNLSNCILSYTLSDGSVAVVKEYGEVYGTRDKTNAFGGMSFSLSEDSGDMKFENHPIAGICLDGSDLIVSIATNLAYISGKDGYDTGSGSTPYRNTANNNNYTADNEDNGYGYEFEESNYNPDYSNFDTGYDSSIMEQFGYSKEINDNDEFMWVANLVGNVSISSLSAIEDYEVKTCDHHYVHFDETYFTKDDDGNWNTGDCYVCVECGKSVEEPTEPNPDANWSQTGTSYEEQKEQYEIDKAEYDAVVEAAGHTYVPENAEWSEDYSSVTFSGDMACSEDCAEKKDQLDCLLQDDTISVTLSEPFTATSENITSEITGTCDEGTTVIYTATGKTTEGYKYVVTTSVKNEPGEHTYEAAFTWTPTTDEEGNVTGYSAATADVTCVVCGEKHEGVEATISMESREAACTVTGADVYTATATVDGETFTDTQEIKTAEALGHDYAATFTWADDLSSATADITCQREGCGDTHGDVAATVTSEVTKEATCAEEGVTTYTATATLTDAEGNAIYTATDSKDVAIPKNENHVWDEGKITKQPTRAGNPEKTVPGEKTYTCTICGATKTEDYYKPVGEIFTDVPASEWYHPYVQYAYDNGLMNGTSATTFEPRSSLSRAMVVQILYSNAGKPDVSGYTSKFSDVQDSSAWYYNAVVWAANQEVPVVSGYEDGTFRPNRNVTRQELAVILYADAGKPAVEGSLSSFADAGSVADYAVNAMIWATQVGVMSGSNENGTLYLNPTKNTTRAEAATMFKAYVELDAEA